MENILVRGRLKQLREEMLKKQIGWYLIPTADYHSSEYVNDFFKVREFFTGFTGSNGTLLLSGDFAGLWTDGRYFIQAERELQGTGVTLFRMLEEGVPTLEEYLLDQLKKGQILGFDGRAVEASLGQRFEKLVSSKGATLVYEFDLAGAVWQERPNMPENPLMILEESISGMSCIDKLSSVRDIMKKVQAEVHVLSKLDDIMWLFNLRGGDIPCNPVAMSYAVVFAQEREGKQAELFLQPSAANKELGEYAAVNRFGIGDYGKTEEYLNQQLCVGKIGIDDDKINYLLYRILEKRSELMIMKNPTELLKAVKNKTEQENMRKVYVKDSAVLTRFIYWIKHSVREEEITEVRAAEYLDGLRAETEGFIDLSFPTISAYKENAAMMHYQAEPETCALLKQEGMLLVDSGGQFLGGTTDVTRTIVLGAVSGQMKKHFTLTAVGMLRLLNARFMYGCTGRNLDILARGPLWEIGVDYKCGTGHGIGYMLNVHEGPADIRWRNREGAEETALEEGMVISNEPGVYIEGSHGIRTENIMLCRKGDKNGDGQFMYFEPLTLVPIDREAIDSVLLTDQDRRQLNEYHSLVFKKIAPLLEGKEREWLGQVTAPL